MSRAPVLTVRDLRVHFPLGGGLLRRPALLRAVDGVSFELAAGETLGIVGETGCGKSTLGRAILRLIEPSAGSVVWLGRDLMRLAEPELRGLRRDLQIVFQDPLGSLDPRMTVAEIVGEPLLTHLPELGRAARRQRVEAMLAEVGLGPGALDRYPHEFSGGQAQRIGIARAMILQPRLLVCDEPVSALDVSIRAQIVNLLIALQRAHGLSMIFISHDLAVVRQIAQRVMVLYLGKTAEIADVEAIFAVPRHPYTQALIAAVPIPDPDRERERAKGRLVLSGEPPSPLAPPSGCHFRTRCPKAQPLCAEQAPDLYQVGPGHRAACHFWDSPMP